jgi:hypothetical protein
MDKVINSVNAALRDASGLGLSVAVSNVTGSNPPILLSDSSSPASTYILLFHDYTGILTAMRDTPSAMQAVLVYLEALSLLSVRFEVRLFPTLALKP